jgi:tripartite-type tricarboxylate transporter receptor subunit TctC
MRGPYVLVAHPSFRPNTLAELVAYAKANPGKANYASFGTNTLNHLYGEMLKSLTGIEAVHVPYKGGAPAMIDLLGGQVQFMFENIGIVVPHIRAGKLKGLAVMAPQRVAVFPNMQTLAEAGADMGSGTWLGLLAPVKTPKRIVEKLHAEVVAALKSPEVRKGFEDRVIQPVGSTPDDFGRHIRSELTQWRQLVTKMGLKPQ